MSTKLVNTDHVYALKNTLDKVPEKLDKEARRLIKKEAALRKQITEFNEDVDLLWADMRSSRIWTKERLQDAIKALTLV